MKEKIEFAFNLTEMEFRQLIKKEEVKPFTIEQKLTDFENKKDYKLTLTLQEVN